MAEPVIPFRRVNKWFGKLYVLRDIDLTVAPGEVVVVCGPSGSGKSTLIRCVNGLERVQEGDIVALTVPTWAPAFAQGLSGKNVWRASREPGKCTNSTDVRQGEPHQKKGTRATYGCKYSTARLLYTATIVED